MRPVELSWIAAGCASTSPWLEHLSEPGSPQVCHTQRTITDNRHRLIPLPHRACSKCSSCLVRNTKGLDEYSLSPRGVWDRSLNLYMDVYTPLCLGFGYGMSVVIVNL